MSSRVEAEASRPSDLPGLEADEERGSESPGLSFVSVEGHTNFHYEPGRLLLADEFSWISLIPIAEQNNSFLAAFPRRSLES